MAIHFKTSKERLDFLKGKHKEIVPVEVKPVEIKIERKKDVDIDEVVAKATKEVMAKKQAQKKKAKDDGEVQAK